MHFEPSGQMDLARVRFEAEPAPTVFGGSGGAPGGQDDPFGWGGVVAMTGFEMGPVVLELVEEELIEGKAGEAKCGLGQLTARKRGSAPRHKNVRRFDRAELVELGAQAKGLDHGESAAAEVFSADAVPGKGASLKKSDGDIFLAEAKAQSQAGETSSENGDRFQGGLWAEKKWVKRPAGRSCRVQAG